MGQIQSYITEVLIIQLLLVVFYLLIIRNEKCFVFNRFFLLASLVIPWYIPLIHFHIHFTGMAHQSILPADPSPWANIENMPFDQEPVHIAPNPGISWAPWVIGLYVAVTFYFIVRFFINLRKINNLEKKASKIELSRSKYLVYHVPTNVLSYSFVNRIFITDQFKLDKAQKEYILGHEIIHLVQNHSWDLLLVELFRIFVWWNPLIYFIGSELKIIHEYLADKPFASGGNKNDYVALLSRYRWLNLQLKLIHGFNQSSITKRLDMMNKTNTPRRFLKMWALILSSLLVFAIFSCDVNNKDAVSPSIKSAQIPLTEQVENEISFTKTHFPFAPKALIDKYADLQRADPQHYYELSINPVITKNGKLFKPLFFDPLSNIFNVVLTEEMPEGPMKEMTRKWSFEDGKFQGMQFQIRKADRAEFMKVKYKTSGEDDAIHYTTDITPNFKNGKAGWEKFVKTHVKYPEAARKAGIKNTIMVQFVVTKRGGAMNVNIAGSPQLNNEPLEVAFERSAYDVVMASNGLWIPGEINGQYVNSKVTLPVEFKPYQY